MQLIYSFESAEYKVCLFENYVKGTFVKSPYADIDLSTRKMNSNLNLFSTNTALYIYHHSAYCAFTTRVYGKFKLESTTINKPPERKNQGSTDKKMESKNYQS